jgi:hypothetical protein
MRTDVIEFKSLHSRFAVVNPDGDAELGTWLIALTWRKAYAECIAAALQKDEMEKLTPSDDPLL